MNQSIEKALVLLLPAEDLALSGVQVVAIRPETLSVTWVLAPLTVYQPGKRSVLGLGSTEP